MTNIELFKRDFIYFSERGRKGGREGEKHQCVAASFMSPTGDLAYNPGMCPDWESNQRSFASQIGTQQLSHTSQGKYRTFEFWNFHIQGEESFFFLFSFFLVP